MLREVAQHYRELTAELSVGSGLSFLTRSSNLIMYIVCITLDSLKFRISTSFR